MKRSSTSGRKGGKASNQVRLPSITMVANVNKRVRKDEGQNAIVQVTSRNSKAITPPSRVNTRSKGCAQVTIPAVLNESEEFSDSTPQAGTSHEGRTRKAMGKNSKQKEILFREGNNTFSMAVENPAENSAADDESDEEVIFNSQHSTQRGEPTTQSDDDTDSVKILPITEADK